ncbi:hypothetical protein CLV30_10573 [Haloactinopolyspora alba]|uniref:Uncharacterized protein n=1 Tax=Haloactinopolyspora alba TaxID=648780 RepID=A0A2P8E567_9ACTN|nr:hypothetical protein [Haloactinopolyspora alba]PSL04609.1 hypothetical protein CLV30_10573 [Haloactinopolyspora alba]
MGYSGLIYAAIVAAWAAFLVPRWVRRNEEVERAREADTARGVRVLRRRSGSIHAPHRAAEGQREAPDDQTPAADTDRPARTQEPAELTPDQLDALFGAAALRRRRILAVLVVATAVAAVTALAGISPAWTPAMTVGLTGVFLVLARRAAVLQAQRRREAARRVPAESGGAAHAVDDDSADEGEHAVDDGISGRRLVLPDPVESADDADGWQPVPVPLPTYLTKAKAPRQSRRIDLGQEGSWTSGRLDPVGSVELPRRAPDERAPEAPDTAVPGTATADTSDAAAESDAAVSDLPEHRRAVGD